MKPLAQDHQVRLFRRFGFLSLTLALLLQVAAAPGQGTVFQWLSVGLLAAWPWLLEALRESAHPQPAFDQWLQPAEAAVITLVLLRCGFDLDQLAWSLSALLLCHLAQSGARRALVSATAALIAVGLSQWLLPVGQRFSFTQWHDASASAASRVVLVLLTLLLAAAFAHIGYRRSLRLHAAKQLLQARGQALQQMNQRLARYLPAELPARIRAAPQDPLPAARRWVTVVFVDLCDFSTLAQQLEPEALGLLLNDYLARLDRTCGRAGASLSKIIGDGALLLFESVEPHRQAQLARRALLLCRLLPLELVQLRQRLRIQGIAAPLALRCGVASGFCSVGDWGQARLDYTVIGEAVNVAARLQSCAQPGAVLLDEATAALVDDHVALTGPIIAHLKGLGERQTFEVITDPSVDQAMLSAIVPGDFAVPGDTVSTVVAATEKDYERTQVVFAGRPRGTH